MSEEEIKQLQAEAQESKKLVGLLNQKIKLLQIALEEIRDFDDDSEWEDPGEIAKEALRIQ